MDFLQEVADRVNIYHGTGKLYLIGNNGKVVAATGQPQVRGRSLSDLISSGDYAVYLNTVKTGRERYQLTKDYLVAIVPIRFGHADNRWAAMILLPSKVIVAPANVLMWQLIGLSITMLMAGVGALWFVAGQIAHPIKQIAGVARVVAAGNLEQMVTIGPRYDELGMLANDFNHMTRSLRDLYGVLEKRVSELQLAEDVIRKANERLRDIANKVPGVVYQFFAKDNGEWGLYFVSERSDDIFGVKAEPLETYFTRFLECVAEEDKERFITSIKEAISCESSWDFEGKLITPTVKEEKYVRGASVSKRQKGEIVFNGILLDITERKRVEEVVRANEARFRAVLENSQVALYKRDYASNTYEYMSPVIKNITGYTSEELISMSVEEVNALINPDDVHTIQQALRTAVANGGGKIHFEYRFTHKNGQIRWVSDVGEMTLDSNGTPIYCLGSVQDITERKKSDDELEKYRNHLEELVKERTMELNVINQELEAFSYTVSHDLRAPLRHIDGFMEMLQNMTEGKLDEQCRRYMHNILDSTNKMGTLIDDLLAFSRLGRYGMNIRPVDMDDITHDVIKEFSQDVKGRHISWCIAQLPTVMGDQSLLHTVMVNLVSNAIKFTRHREQAEIEIGYRSEDAEIVIFVRDNGVGFDPNYMDNLFGVFQRLHSDEEFEGNGVGLANVRRIISRHGGRTWAEGNNDRGATIYFSLPKIQTRSVSIL
ncbi:MAG: PAS domain-containing protein [Spirochaetes bacterium]|nr:PAS domain-containing protein [Spirochaetota bacterium]